nr:hypothetical protein [Tanacetum cinerariifolium]
MKDKLFAHQETISILSKQKEAQIKLYKTREDKELDKVIELENKVKVLDNIVYKTGQSVQTMNMLNNKCRTSFAKPEFLKKTQRANPRLYDIGFYNDNLALMLTPDSDEDLKAQLQDKGIVISELKKLIEKLKGQYVDTKFEKSSVIRQPNAFKRVIPTTSVSRPQLKSNPQGDRVMYNNSEGKKQAVEDHRRSVKLSKNKTSVTHDMCVLTSVAKPIKETVASESNKKPRNFIRKLYERVSKTCSWWYSKYTPSGYKWKHKSGKENVNPNLVEIVLFIVNSGFSKHMTGNLKLLINFVEKFPGTVKFRNDQIAPILGYGDLGNDLLTGSHGTDLYSITLQDINSLNPICLMAKVTSSQA